MKSPAGQVEGLIKPPFLTNVKETTHFTGHENMYFIGLGPALLILSACSTLDVVPATSISSEGSSEIYYFDPGSRISYRVYSDPDTLYLKLKINQKSIMTKMLRQGTKVYFDLNGKKKKDVYVQYPVPGQNQQGTTQYQQGMLQEMNPGRYGQRPGPGRMLLGECLQA